MANFNIQITNLGRALQAKAQTGTQLLFTRMRIGSGSLSGQQIAELTNLITPQKWLTINKSVTSSSGTHTLGAALSNADITVGFYFREWGIFAQDPDVGEILYSYGNVGAGAEYISAGGGSDVIEKQLDAIAIIGNASNVSAVIDESLVFPSLADFNAHINDNVKHITAAERTNWNAKETTAGAQTKATAAQNAAISVAATDATTKVNAVQANLTIHDDNTTKHITAAERTAWNAKQAALGYVPENAANKNVASGYAGLDSNRKILPELIPDSIIGQVEYQGTWNGATNTPTLPAASSVKGHYYVVSVAGSYASVTFDVGDWIISNGSVWQKVNNTDAVSTVFGRSGNVVAATNDYTWNQINKSVSSIADITTRNLSDLTQNASFRTVTDTEKNTWNGKASTSIATTSANGLMSSSDKSKLDGVAAYANNYTHPTGSGNNHIPAGGAAGQYLKYSAAGVAAWSAPAKSDVGLGSVDNAKQATKVEFDAHVSSVAEQLADIALNVKAFGAKGDGLSDDTMAILTCIAAAKLTGSVVYFPAGIYCTNQLRIQDKVIIRGAGIDRTVIKANTGVNTLFIWIDSVDESCVEDLTVDGNATNQTDGSSLVLYKTRRSIVRRVKVINSKTIALNMSNCEDCNVEECHLDGTLVSTVLSFSSDDANYGKGNNKVVNSTIENGALDGIIYNVNNGLISGNTIRNNGAIVSNTAGGVYVNNKRGIILVNNVIYGNDGNGIDLMGASNAVVEGNIVYDNNSAGIMLSGSSYVTIADNISYNNGKAPVSNQEDGISLLGACSRIMVTGNVCYDNQTVKTQPFGLDIASTATNITVVSNNFIGNVNTDGIRNQSTNDEVCFFANQPFNKFSNSIKSFSFSLAAGESFVLSHSPTAMVVVEIADKSLQTYGRYFLRGSNNGVQELEDPANAFEPSDTGTYNAIFHNGTNFVLKNRRSTTAYYSYMISYI